jgi:hypothetical protein
MNASQVHAVLAAGLENPTLIARWRHEPDLLRKCGVDPDTIDLDALWKFAGLSVKVRHNGLRGDLPLTFRLLNVAGLEIEVFSSYASFRAAEGKSYASTSEARSQDLLMFLEHWLDADNHAHALLWDLMRHELTLSQLRKIPQSAEGVTADHPHVQAPLRAHTVPRVCGELALHEMRSDPRVTEKLLRRKLPDLREVSLGKHHFGYWRKSDELFVLQLDELAFYLLSMIDGKRSTADLSYLIDGRRRPNPGLRRALGELAAIGILAFA